MDVCFATWARGGPAELAIVAQGPLLLLTFSSSAFAVGKTTAAIVLRDEGAGELRRPVMWAASTYAITIDSKVDSLLLHARPLVVTLQGKDYTYPLANVSAAMDAVRRCVKEPTRAELAARPEPSFPMPAGWQLLDDMGSGCAARLGGEQVDTLVSLNDKEQVLLLAGHNDWAIWPSEVPLQFQFDTAPPQSLRGFGYNNIVIIVVSDDADVVKLRKATKLTWHLPTGVYSALVHDMGPVLDAVTACTRQKRLTKNH